MSVFEQLFDHLRRERNRCIRKGDVRGARAFDLADAELRAALLDLAFELDSFDKPGE